MKKLLIMGRLRHESVRSIVKYNYKQMKIEIPQLIYAKPDTQNVEQLMQALGLHPVIASLLVNRGIETEDRARAYLAKIPDFSQITDPFHIRNMDKAVERIYAAIEQGEKILIFGDFDADGITATAILTEFLNFAKADLTWYIPHRIKEGYSLQENHIAMAAEMDIDLIITVDCGISSLDAVNQATKEDIDVIITDHHEPIDELPSALAILDPKQPGCHSGLDFLAGVGVAFFLIMALRKFFREQGFWKNISEPPLIPFLDLFTIGTIGDMVPMIKENRMLCNIGIKQIRRGTRPGLAALSKAACLDPTRIDFEDLSFKLIPRINAAGRLSHARICVSLLTCLNHMDAQKTAFVLDELNHKRQVIERDIIKNIQHRIAMQPSLLRDRILLLWDKNWDPSVLGIAASKLSKIYCRPVVLLTFVNNKIIGSCRSINQLNIHKALAENAHLLDRFGGHVMAAGLTLSMEKNITTLARSLNDHFDSLYSDQDFKKSINIDAELNFKDLTLELVKSIDELKPFGPDNPEPLFIIRNARIISSQILNGRHRKMIINDPKHPISPPIEAFHFNLNDQPDNLSINYEPLIVKLKLNKFKTNAIQLLVQSF